MFAKRLTIGTSFSSTLPGPFFSIRFAVLMTCSNASTAISMSLVGTAFALTLPFRNAIPVSPVRSSIPKSPVGFSIPFARCNRAPTSRIIKSSSRSTVITWLIASRFLAACPLVNTIVKTAGSDSLATGLPDLFDYTHPDSDWHGSLSINALNLYLYIVFPLGLHLNRRTLCHIRLKRLGIAPLQIPTVLNGYRCVLARHHRCQSKGAVAVTLIAAKILRIGHWVLVNQDNHHAAQGCVVLQSDAINLPQSLGHLQGQLHGSTRGHVQDSASHAAARGRHALEEIVYGRD